MPELDLGPVKPIKGIDYFTEAETTSIKNDLETHCDTYINSVLGSLNGALQAKLEGDT